MTDIQPVLDAIRDCDDQDLDYIARALTARREFLRQQRTMSNLASLKVGDKVRIRSAKPKYLVGTRAEIIARKGDKFVIQLDDNADRRAFIRFGGQPVCPASMLEKI